MRAHLASGCADDLALWLGADRSLQPKEAHFLALLTQATGVDAATRLHERRPVAPPTLASLRHALREMGALLSRHAHMVRVDPPNLNPNPNPNPNPGALLSRHAHSKRPKMPELLHLDPRAQPLQQQHLHWGFDRLRPRETLGLRGKSSLDREQGGLKSVDFFRLDTLGASPPDDDGGTELTDAARLQRRFVGCLKMMREGHAVCLKLANLEDATWRGKLVCATLAELFLRRLPLPLPPKESGGCTWAASRRPDPLDDACVVAAVLEQVRVRIRVSARAG